MDGVILALESSGEHGGAALLRGGEVVAEADVSGPRRHGAELMPCVDRVCEQAGVARADIDVIAVNCGPGSYTGLRIGLASAAAIGYALDKPVIGVPGLEAMALQYVLDDDFEVAVKAELWPVLDARRDEVMTARYVFDDGDLERATADRLLSPEALTEEAADGAVVFGDGVQVFGERFGGKLNVVKKEFYLSARAVALQAARQLAEVEDWSLLERKPVEPRYFRRVLAKTVAERAAERE